MAYLFCDSCGAPLTENDATCPQCGRGMDEMRLMEQAAEQADAETLAQTDLLDAEPQSQPTPQPEPMPQPCEQPTPHAPLYAARPHSQANPLYASLPQNTQPELLTFADYFGMLVLSLVPLGGLLALLIWSFGTHTGANRRNYARALLVAKIALDFFLVCAVFALAFLPYFLYY